MADNLRVMEDSELAQKARGGDRNAFGTLVERYQSPIYGFALHFFRSPDVAEDVAQETFLRAFRFLHSYDESRRFVTWLYSIARNICIDRHRERARKEGVPLDDVPADQLMNEDPENDPLGNLLRREARRVLKSAVDNLPEKYKTPIILCYMEGLSYQEIGEVLGISLNNTKIRIFRAKKLLLDQLGAGEGEV